MTGVASVEMKKEAIQEMITAILRTKTVAAPEIATANRKRKVILSREVKSILTRSIRRTTRKAIVYRRTIINKNTPLT
jgi:hypothetical protein